MQLLAEPGFEQFDDDDIDTIVVAVAAANAGSKFAGLTTAEANTAAEETARDSSAVQTALRDNRVAAGDADCNGVVGTADVGAVVAALFEPDCVGADANGDTVVTAADVSALNATLGASASAARTRATTSRLACGVEWIFEGRWLR